MSRRSIHRQAGRAISMLPALILRGTPDRQRGCGTHPHVLGLAWLSAPPDAFAAKPASVGRRGPPPVGKQRCLRHEIPKKIRSNGARQGHGKSRSGGIGVTVTERFSVDFVTRQWS